MRLLITPWVTLGGPCLGQRWGKYGKGECKEMQVILLTLAQGEPVTLGCESDWVLFVFPEGLALWGIDTYL